VNKEVFMQVGARHIGQLGRELVTDYVTALTELVKNSYDADAEAVEIRFENLKENDGRIIILDTGNGITSNDIIKKWAVIGTNNKIKDSYSSKYKRRYAGKKGIGRFAVERLAEHCTIVSFTDNERFEYFNNWNLYEGINIPEFEQRCEILKYSDDISSAKYLKCVIEYLLLTDTVLQEDKSKLISFLGTNDINFKLFLGNALWLSSLERVVLPIMEKYKDNEQMVQEVGSVMSDNDTKKLESFYNSLKQVYKNRNIIKEHVTGTIMVLDHLRDQWNQTDIEKIIKELILLVAPSKTKDNNFKISISAEEFPNLERIELTNDVLDMAYAEVQAYFSDEEIDGTIKKQFVIQYKEFNSDKVKIKQEDVLTPFLCGDFNLHLNYFVRDAKYLKKLVDEIEKNKVNEVLKPLNGQTEILQYNIDNYEFYIGKFGNYDVIHVQTKIGSLGEGASTLTIDKALNIWKIQMVVMIGIAFGRGADCNQKIGDVLISKDIYMYEKYKIKERKDGTLNYKHLSNPYSNAGKILVKKFEDDCVWENSNSLRPKIHFGTIASGEKIIDSITEKNKLLELGDTTYIIGGEMEATGLAAACSNNNIHEWIVIKGISDWGDGNKVKNKEENQKMAINNTVSYCEYIFSKEKVFDEILEEDPTNFLEKMYKFPIMNTFSSIDILENYEVSLVPISSATQKLIQRKQIINKLKSELDNGNHINIFGEIFSGKTTLIKLLASQYRDNIKYIDLRDKDIMQIEKTLFIILQIILELESETNLIIAIDNYPRTNKNSKTEDLLERLLKEANTRNIKVIFTSLTSQENIIEDNIQNISYLDVDEIEKNDVIDLLKLYDAPSYMYQDKIVEFIEITGNRKLFVVKQIIKYLQKENWDIFKDGLIGIIDGKYVWKIKGTIQDALLDRVTQDNQKELLYRMGCINYDLKIDEVKKISEVEPQISNPIEILREIEGSFVEYDNEKNMYRTNPLIAQISRENINSKTFININKAMAYNILDKKAISPFEIIKCIGFFNQAKEYDEELKDISKEFINIFQLHSILLKY